MTNIKSKIKWVLLIVNILLFSSCTSNEIPNYIGKSPYYTLSNAPHPASCGCCLNKVKYGK